MIVKFKLFEELNETPPKVGDYVIVEEEDEDVFGDIDYINFINSSIGYIFKSPGKSIHLVKYYNIPDNIKKYFQYSDFSEGLKIGNGIIASNDKIKYWSKNKEDLLPFIAINKYNL
jgi:hypothetical protein